tara:strand:- start:68 stop:187 length:120 start_codon:yes stop_codon:yes gene_type:complete
MEIISIHIKNTNKINKLSINSYQMNKGKKIINEYIREYI